MSNSIQLTSSRTNINAHPDIHLYPTFKFNHQRLSFRLVVGAFRLLGQLGPPTVLHRREFQPSSLLDSKAICAVSTDASRAETDSSNWSPSPVNGGLSIPFLYWSALLSGCYCKYLAYYLSLAGGCQINPRIELREPSLRRTGKRGPHLAFISIFSGPNAGEDPDMKITPLLKNLSTTYSGSKRFTPAVKCGRPGHPQEKGPLEHISLLFNIQTANRVFRAPPRRGRPGRPRRDGLQAHMHQGLCTTKTRHILLTQETVCSGRRLAAGVSDARGERECSLTYTRGSAPQRPDTYICVEYSLSLRLYLGSLLQE
ncbi:hypothetical protein C8R44DRAFT_744611 [Mycena epipterygia]|nr:hypothetical protein C8R44DRAFT_744611 [Mycena epipterygia]